MPSHVSFLLDERRVQSPIILIVAFSPFLAVVWLHVHEVGKVEVMYVTHRSYIGAFQPNGQISALLLQPGKSCKETTVRF